MAYSSVTTSLTAHADTNGIVTVTGNTAVLEAWGSSGVIDALAQSAVDMLHGGGWHVGPALERTAGAVTFAIVADGGA